MQSQVYHLKEKPEKVLNLHVYGGADGEFDYYEDDGETYAYESGDYYSRKIRMDWKNRVLFFEEAHGKRKTRFSNLRIYFHSCETETARMNGKELRITNEDVRFIEPISDFDPYQKPTLESGTIRDVPVLTIDNMEDSFKILFN
jgi:alpha-glucosidase